MKTNLKAMVERILEACETERKVSASVIRLMRDMRAELRAALRSYLAPVCLPARETLTPEKRRQVDLTKVRYLELCKRSDAVSMLAVARRTIEEARRNGRTGGYVKPASLRLQVQREILNDRQAGGLSSDR